MKKRPKPKGRQPTTATAARRGQPEAPVFPIVGIGASAGGLEALEQFLKPVPPGSNMSFVVVQHLDPTHTGMLAELLQRASALAVLQVTDRMRVEPGHVYVIPPNKDMSIVHGVLHLLAPVAPRGLRLPIDFFFRSLAEDLRERSIGVLLSGMGSDGTLGVRAIRERAGAAFVQAPASAKFDGMPRSAIDAGLADVVAPADQLAAKISEYLQHARRVASPERLAPSSEAQSALERCLRASSLPSVANRCCVQSSSTRTSSFADSQPCSGGYWAHTSSWCWRSPTTSGKSGSIRPSSSR